VSDSRQRPDDPTPKAALRDRLLAARRALSAEVRAAAARRVQAALTAVLAARSGPVTVTGYVPLGAEPGGPDLPAVLAGALPAGGRLLLPVLLPDRSLDWVRYEPATVLAADAWRSPPGARLGPAAIGAATLVVTPALAVDRRGVRLGRGGGSYDRALARVAPGTPVVALLHDGELLDEDLPAEPHDRRVSAVVTPSLGLVPLPAPPAGGAHRREQGRVTRVTH
jgi:5-formyltetrahydrofolate cyclo-ligase